MAFRQPEWNFKFNVWKRSSYKHYLSGSGKERWEEEDAFNSRLPYMMEKIETRIEVIVIASISIIGK
jgi:hypothetical protein